MLKQLTSTGFSFKPNTILGEVFNFSDKSKASVTNLAPTVFHEESEAVKKQKTEEFSTTKPKINQKYISIIFSC